MYNFYGIKDIKVIYHGEWSDPEIRYNNKVVNFYDIDNYFYEEFLEYNNNLEHNDIGGYEFARYMQDNVERVKEYIEEYGIIESE